MSLITRYPNFIIEFNRKDLNLITSDEISERFTIAFEIEMECDDPKVEPITHEQDLVDELRNKTYSLLKNEKVDYSEKIMFIEEVANGCDFDDDDETLDNVLNWDLYKDKTEQVIVYYMNIIFQDIFERVDRKIIRHSYEKDFLKYLTGKVRLHFPKLWRKYRNDMECVMDMTLDKGIEIKQKTYIQGINNAIEFLNDFFAEFNSQTYWKFTPKTGLHINIGYIGRGVKWNIVKGMVLLKDLKRGEIPFVFKDMIWRMNTHFTESVFNQIEVDKTQVDLSDIGRTERYLTSLINRTMKKLGYKHFGFNISKIKKEKYVEFRYVGGVINENLIVNKMLYFCYIVYLMTTPDYKRREYLKALYKFVDGLK
jgi:hypothetical protein